MTGFLVGTPVLAGLIATALLFDFLNGLHDSANSIATVVATRVLRPFNAVLWAAFFNFIALAVFGLHVAATISSGVVDAGIVNPVVIFGALYGAIVWNVVTWRLGIPSSSSHALVGGLALAMALVLAVSWLAVRPTPFAVDRRFRVLQFVSSSLLSMAHGGNDAQKSLIPADRLLCV